MGGEVSTSPCRYFNTHQRSLSWSGCRFGDLSAQPFIMGQRIKSRFEGHLGGLVG